MDCQVQSDHRSQEKVNVDECEFHQKVWIDFGKNPDEVAKFLSKIRGEPEKKSEKMGTKIRIETRNKRYK